MHNNIHVHTTYRLSLCICNITNKKINLKLLHDAGGKKIMRACKFNEEKKDEIRALFQFAQSKSMQYLIACTNKKVK